MANEVAIKVLEDEIGILGRLAGQANASKSTYRKQCAEKISDVERQINTLLAKAGVLNEHNELAAKKVSLRKELDNVLSEIDVQIEQAQNIIIYLRSRIAALSAELPEEG